MSEKMQCEDCMHCKDCMHYEEYRITQKGSSIGRCRIKSYAIHANEGRYGNNKACKTYFKTKEKEHK